MKLTDAQWQLIQALFETDDSPRQGASMGCALPAPPRRSQ
jgi:hypothetical protein